MVLERQIDVLRKINEFARLSDDTQLASLSAQVTARRFTSLLPPKGHRHWCCTCTYGHSQPPGRGCPAAGPAHPSPEAPRDGAGGGRQLVEEQQKLAAVGGNQRQR